MKDFEHKIKEILENAPAIQPSAARMNRMQRKLAEANATQENRKPSGLIWWLIPLCLISALVGGSLVYWFSQNQENQKIIELENQIAAIHQDTVYINNTIYRIDTISKTIYDTKYIQQPNTDFAFNPNNQLTHWANWGKTSHYDAQNLLSPKESLLFGAKPHLTGVRSLFSHEISTTSNRFDFSDIETAAENNTKLTNTSSLQNIPSLSPENVYQMRKTRFPLDDLLAYAPKQELSKKQKKSKRYINPLVYFVPTGAQLGLKMGNIGSLNLPNGSAFNFTYGLAGEIHFGKSLRMTGGLEQMHIFYKVKDEQEFANYPTVLAENPFDQLAEIYVDLDYLQIPIGLKYLFRNEKKLRPFVGFSLVARQAKKQHFKYEYISMFRVYEKLHVHGLIKQQLIE